MYSLLCACYFLPFRLQKYKFLSQKRHKKRKIKLNLENTAIYLKDSRRFSSRKNGFFHQKKRLFLSERTAFSHRKNGFFSEGSAGSII